MGSGLSDFTVVLACVCLGATIALAAAARYGENKLPDVRPKIRLGRTPVAIVIIQGSLLAFLLIMHTKLEHEAALVLAVADVLLMLPAFSVAVLMHGVALLRLPCLSAWVCSPIFYVSVGSWSDGFAVFAQALARPTPARIAKLRRRIAARFTLDLPTLVAEALLSARAGETARARAILRGVIRVSPSARHAFMRVFAAHWLCRDALARNAFDEIRALPRVPGSSLALFAWLDMVRIRRRARAEAPSVQTQQVAPSPLQAALRLHARLARNEKVFIEAVFAWDRVLASEAIRGQLVERARALGGTGDIVFATWRAQIERDLTHVIGDADLGAAAETELGSALLDARKRKAIDELEDRISAMKVRMQSRRFVPAVDEWIEMTEVRLCYEKCIALGAIQADVLQVVRHTAWNYAVWLHNDFGEIDLAYTGYAWLFLECRDLGRTEDATILQRNAVNASS